MTILLALCAPILAAGALALHLWVAVYGRNSLARLGLKLFRFFSSKNEAAIFFIESAIDDFRSPKLKIRVRASLKTWLGIWAILSSISFLSLWIIGWTNPKYHVGYFMHFLNSWAAGILIGTFISSIAFSFVLAWQMGRAQLLATQSGLQRIWRAKLNNINGQFRLALREAFDASHRIEVLDFTGHELIAKGPTEEGGILASLFSLYLDKEIRILLFSPFTQGIDPDRKHTTVIQSQLSSMDMSREVFESRLQATVNRIQLLNKNRAKPIEIRLYSEKPSFRTLVAGPIAFLGSIDARDGSGEFPLYEVRQRSADPSLYSAARSHFLRVWGSSIPVQLEAPSTAQTPPGVESDKSTGSQRQSPQRQMS